MKTTPLYDSHIARGAKCIEFAGVQLPVWFSSIQTEHIAVRQTVGIFDISHMGLLKITGPQADVFIQYVSTNDLKKAQPNKMIYSMILNEKGGILDDITVGPHEDGYLMIVNAANLQKILSWFETFHSRFQFQVEVLNPKFAFIAVQGPQAETVIGQVLKLPVADQKRFSIATYSYEGQSITALRTGYTGEDGFEMIVPAALAKTVWEKLLENGATPCGLGARDSLRIEAGLPLYGQELSEEITPLMTRYAWVVKWDKDFVGKAALESAKDQPSKWATVGIEMNDKMIPRPHCEIVEGGHVTSGTLSPVSGKAIGMAVIDPKNSLEGTPVTVIIRNKPFKAKVAKLPF